MRVTTLKITDHSLRYTSLIIEIKSVIQFDTLILINMPCCDSYFFYVLTHLLFLVISPPTIASVFFSTLKTHLLLFLALRRLFKNSQSDFFSDLSCLSSYFFSFINSSVFFRRHRLAWLSIGFSAYAVHFAFRITQQQVRYHGASDTWPDDMKNTDKSVEMIQSHAQTHHCSSRTFQRWRHGCSGW